MKRLVELLTERSHTILRWQQDSKLAHALARPDTQRMRTIRKAAWPRVSSPLIRKQLDRLAEAAHTVLANALQIELAADEIGEVA